MRAVPFQAQPTSKPPRNTKISNCYPFLHVKELPQARYCNATSWQASSSELQSNDSSSLITFFILTSHPGCAVCENQSARYSTSLSPIFRLTEITHFTEMPLRDILKKKAKVANTVTPVELEVEEPPVFTFMRSDTHTQEIISPPTFSSKESSNPPSFTDGHTESRTSRLFKGRSRSVSNASAASTASRTSEQSNAKSPHSKRLSERLHLRRSVASSASVPQDLPEILTADAEGTDGGAGVESQWVKRATMLAKQNDESRSRPASPVGGPTADSGAFKNMAISESPGQEKGVVSSQSVDDNIQEAIRLHEAGELETSTRMFGRLADPNGDNNALSQVLYGLALR